MEHTRFVGMDINPSSRFFQIDLDGRMAGTESAKNRNRSPRKL